MEILWLAVPLAFALFMAHFVEPSERRADKEAKMRSDYDNKGDTV